MRIPVFAILIGLAATGVSGSPGDTRRLLRWPTVSQTQIAFSHAGDLWVVAREGGDARRLAGDFPEVRPHFEKLGAKKILAAGISPTGQRALFEAHGEILTVPAEKGDIRNLTQNYHQRLPASP